MRMIDADALLEHLKNDPLYDLIERYGISEVIKSQPTVSEWDDDLKCTILMNKKVAVMSEDKTIFGRAIRESHYKDGYGLITVMYNDRHEDAVQLHHKEPK